MKRILIILSLLFLSESVLAGAAEDLSMNLYDIGMRQRNGIKISGVAVNDGVVTYNASQEIIQGGSKYKIEQKNIALNAANDSFYKNTAKIGKSLLKGGAIAVGATVVFDQFLDALDWVIGDGGKIQKDTSNNIYGKFSLPNASPRFNCTQTELNACAAEFLNSRYPQYSNNHKTVQHTRNNEYQLNVYWAPGQGTIIQQVILKDTSVVVTPPDAPVVSDPEIETAMSNWLKNNPSSVTDPVVTYIYSPKDPKTGEVVPNTTSDHPSFGPHEINDEMMNNYIDNYHDRLARENKPEETIQKPESETKTDPSGETTTTTVNPDGSTTTTRTKTEVNPDTGEVTTTKTETTVNPDGLTSTKTETTTSTKPNPETTELPVVCDYFAFLCDFVDWFKKDDVPEPEPDEVLQDIPDIPLAPSTIFSFSGQCPAPFTYELSDPFGNTNTIEFKYDTFCYWLEKIKPWSIAIAHLIGMSMLFGRGQNG